MSKLVAVSREHHAGKKWRRFKDYAFASQVATVPVVTAELAKAALAMPLAFLKSGDHYSLVAVLSLLPNRNLFVAPDGRWLVGHIPALFRCYPFRIIRQQEAGKNILCTDADYALADDGDPDGVDFFDQDGSLSPVLNSVCDFLSQIEGSLRATEAAVSALATAGVIRPWNLKIKGDNGAEQTVEGLHAIEEGALAGLGDEAIVNLHKAGGLPIAYAQLLSMNNINIFSDLSKYQARLATPAPDNLDQLFGIMGNDEVIRFN